jgi:hypothetical protein
MTPLIDLSGGKKAFAVCINDGGYPASLERWKIYRVVADPAAAKHNLIRVVDESGEDYLYPKKLFRLGTLPAPLRRLYTAKAVA